MHQKIVLFVASAHHARVERLEKVRLGNTIVCRSIIDRSSVRTICVSCLSTEALLSLVLYSLAWHVSSETVCGYVGSEWNVWVH